MNELSTTELARIAVAAEAVAAAAKAVIEERGRKAHEAGDKLTVEAVEQDVQAYATTTQDRINITDPSELYAFLQELYPHNFETRTVTTVQPINPNWVAKQLEAWLPQVLKGEMDAPPGTHLVPGGEFVSTTVRPKAGVKRALQEAAHARLVQGELPALVNTQVALTA